MQQNKMRIRILTAGMLVFLSTAAFAESLYVGTSAWRARWNVGVADKQAQNAAEGFVPSSLIAQGALRAVFANGGQYTTLFLNAPANATLNTYGVFGSYGFDSGWGISLSASAGKTGFSSDRTVFFQSVFTGLSTNTQASVVPDSVLAKRSDFDLVISKRLGGSGFSAFGGIKGQGWSYASRDDVSVGADAVNSVGNAGVGIGSFSTVGAAAFKFNYRSQAFGPAAGLMYTLVLSDRHSFGAQIAAVNLDGTLRMDESNFVRYSNITSGSQTFAGSTGYFRDRITDRLWMPGFTGKLDYRLSFQTVVFRIGVFYQEMKMQSRNARDDGISLLTTDATPGSAGTVVPLPATPTRLQPNFSVNGAKDIFKGVSFSAAVKVF